MATVQEVQLLNKKIESINTQRTKIETQEEMLKKRLEGELNEFEEKFGIKLKGKTLAETKKLIEAQVKKQTEAIKKEYDVKSKVVAAIDSGDIDQANELLGNKVEKVAEVVEEPETEIGTEEISVEEENLIEDNAAEIDDFDMDLSDDSEISIEEEEEIEVEIGVEEEEMNMSADSGSMKMQSVEEAFSDMELSDDEDDGDGEEEMYMSVDDEDTMVVDDSDINDLGFGDMLKGSKFEI